MRKEPKGRLKLGTLPESSKVLFLMREFEVRWVGARIGRGVEAVLCDEGRQGSEGVGAGTDDAVAFPGCLGFGCPAGHAGEETAADAERTGRSGSLEKIATIHSV